MKPSTAWHILYPKASAAVCRVLDIAVKFHAAVREVKASGVQLTAAELMPAARKARVSYYASCELAHFPQRSDGEKAEAWYLVLLSEREASKNYR